MSLLTEQEIEDLYHTELDRRELSFARAVEAKVIEKIKAQGFVGYWNGRETVFFEHELLGDMRPFYDINITIFRLPEGD